MMASHVSQGTARETDAPKLGLRFDRGRTELVLDAPLALAHGLRLDAMRTELAPLAGRLSLTEGWRAFRHRRSSLVSATISIGLRELASWIGQKLGLATELVALGASSLSLATSSDALSLAAELEWGWDDGDLLVVVRGARSIPLGPRAPLALVHDLAREAGATFDATRGVARLPSPLRRALRGAMVAAGLRVPSASGLATRAYVEDGRLVITSDRTVGGVAEASRESLEASRADAAVIAACLDGDGPAPDETSLVANAALALARELERDAVEQSLASAATDYAQRERHPSMASTALLHAAEHARAHRTTSARLAAAAITRGGLSRPTSVARAIELATSAHVAALPWEQLTRALEGAGPTVMRARALALEGSGRLAEALGAFADVARREPKDDVAQRGIARALSALARHDEAITAWDRVAQLAGATDAKLRAARATLAAGRTEGAIARLRVLVSEGALRPTPTILAAHVELTSTLSDLGRLPEALEADRSLASLVDSLGPIEASAAADALRAALARALVAQDLSLARAHLDALARTLGDVGADEIAGHASAIARAETSALGAGDAATLRSRAESLRAAGEHGDAARVLVELFAQTKDAAVLRAAIELADRAPDRAARLAVFDRALALLPAGPARDAIAARR